MQGKRDRTLLFRLYLMLVIGLIAVAALLDYGFRALQSRVAPEDEWQNATFSVVESRLAAVSAADRAGEAVALSDALGVPVELLSSDAIHRAGDASDEPQEFVDAEGRSTWLIAAPTLDGVIRIGPVAAPEENGWLRLIPPLFYLSIFVFVGFWLRPLLRDLDTITASTRAFAADYRDTKPTAPDVTSLNELAVNYDAMSERLSGLIQSQKELTSALSHEMRTPLARIKFALAVLDNDGDEKTRKEIEAVSDDVQEIDALISTMLNYARLDHPDTRMDWQATEIAPWLKQTIEKARLPQKQVSVGEAFGGNARMDVRLMALALSNLVTNACRHAQKRVMVSLRNEAGTCELTVEDDGPGVPEVDREHIFKAFTRLDGSRSRDTGGYGLGLAIVARIAGLHGGTATAGESTRLGGACMTIRWPGAVS